MLGPLSTTRMCWLGIICSTARLIAVGTGHLRHFLSDILVALH